MAKHMTSRKLSAKELDGLGIDLTKVVMIQKSAAATRPGAKPGLLESLGL